MRLLSSSILLLALAGASTPALVAQKQAAQVAHHVYTFHGDRSLGHFGQAMSGGVVRAAGLDGDLDGDKVADILVGAPQDQALANDYTGMVRAISGRTGEVLWTIRGSRGDRFGHAVAFLGDITGDGISDFAVGAWAGERSAASNQEGYVELWSGDARAPTPIPGGRFWGGTARDHFGEYLISTPDLDADGVRDLLVGANQNAYGTGYARVISSKAKRVLFTVQGSYKSAFDGVFASALAAGDLDGDGKAELLVGAQGEPAGLSLLKAGRVYAFKGDGSPLALFDGDAAGENFGHAIAVLPSDLDNNGWKEIAVGVVGVNGQAGEVRAVDSKSGKILARLRGVTSQKDRMGARLARIGDVDGDRIDDLLVGTNASGMRNGYVQLVSGATLRAIPGGKFDGDDAFDAFGSAVAALADVDDDGRPEILIGARYDDDGGTEAGSVRVLSPRAKRLTSDVHFVELRRGGQQLLRVEMGVANASNFCLVLGSLSGRKPGLSLGSLGVLPLNPDPYFDLTLGLPNTVMLRRSLAQLDAEGKTTAFFTAIPQIPRSFAGRTMHHAAIVLAPGRGIVGLTNAVPLLLR